MKLPTMKCKGLCHASCGPIGMSRREYDALRAVVGERIQVEPLNESLLLVSNFHPRTLQCPLLTDGRCAAYEQRPMICRLWGMVKSMRCPFGCRPSRWVSERESRAFLQSVQ